MRSFLGFRRGSLLLVNCDNDSFNPLAVSWFLPATEVIHVFRRINLHNVASTVDRNCWSTKLCVSRKCLVSADLIARSNTWWCTTKPLWDSSRGNGSNCL